MLLLCFPITFNVCEWKRRISQKLKQDSARYKDQRRKHNVSKFFYSERIRAYQVMFVRYARVTLVFLVFFLVFFAPVVFSPNFLTAVGDGSNIALPAYLVPHGFWEPDIMLGYPWASNFNGCWDPLFLLHFIPHSFNIYMLCAYVIAAIGAFGCVRSIAASNVGGAVAGISYSLGGFMIEHLGHYDIVHAAAWTPYVFWSMFEMRRQRGLQPVVLGSVAVGLCAISGQPQVLAYTLLFAAAYIIYNALVNGGKAQLFRRAIASIVLGVGLGSIALMPGALLALRSFRSHASLAYFLGFSIPVWQIPSRLFLPYLLGRSSQPFYAHSSNGVGSNAEFSAYIGLITLLLAAVAVIVRNRDPDIRFLAFASIISVLFSTGDGLHIATVTFHLPIFNLFRAQGRHMLEFTLFGSILGGIGASEISRGNVRLRHFVTAVLITGTAILATVVSAVLSPENFPAGIMTLSNPALYVPFVLFPIACLVILVYFRNPKSLLTAALLVVFTIIDLSSFAWFQEWRSPVSARMLQIPANALPIRAALTQTHQRLFSAAGGTTLDGVPPNLSLIWGVPSAGGYVQLLLTAPGIFLQLFPQGTIAPELLLDGTDRSFDLASIKYALLPPDQAAAFKSARRGWRSVNTSDAGELFENANAEPRARIFHHVILMSPDNALQAIRTSSVDVHTVALVQGTEPLDTLPDSKDTAVIRELRSDDMRVDVFCKTQCFLQTSDTYDSMWIVTIDGRRAPLRMTDYTLRGVFVPAGAHIVRFVYRPWTIMLGAAITILSGCVIGSLLLYRLTRRRTHSHGHIELVSDQRDS